MKGKCLCGAVSITMALKGEKLSACHCEMCRRWCGGPFLALGTQPGSVQVSGPAKVVQTSDWAERAFCADCGSGLWYRMRDPEGEYHVAAGLFDTKEMPIGLELWIDAKPTGYAFAGARRQMTSAELIALFAPADGSSDAPKDMP